MAFISHLDKNVLYSVTLMIIKGKHNVALRYPMDGTDRDGLKTTFDEFFIWLKGHIWKYQKEDINRYRDRLIHTDYVKIIFKPIVNSSSQDDDKNPVREQEEKTSEKRSESSISDTVSRGLTVGSKRVRALRSSKDLSLSKSLLAFGYTKSSLRGTQSRCFSTYYCLCGDSDFVKTNELIEEEILCEGGLYGTKM